MYPHLHSRHHCSSSSSSSCSSKHPASSVAPRIRQQKFKCLGCTYSNIKQKETSLEVTDYRIQAAANPVCAAAACCCCCCCCSQEPPAVVVGLSCWIWGSRFSILSIYYVSFALKGTVYRCPVAVRASLSVGEETSLSLPSKVCGCRCVCVFQLGIQKLPHSNCQFAGRVFMLDLGVYIHLNLYSILTLVCTHVGPFLVVYIFIE